MAIYVARECAREPQGAASASVIEAFGHPGLKVRFMISSIVARDEEVAALTEGALSPIFRA